MYLTGLILYKYDYDHAVNQRPLMSQPTFHPDLNYFCADTEAELQHSGYQSITRQA